MTRDLFNFLEPVPKPAPASPVAPAVRQARKPACQLATGPAPSASHELPSVAGEIVRCESIGGARAWLENNGWSPRHRGGYEKAGHGLAVIKNPHPPACFVFIERK